MLGTIGAIAPLLGLLGTVLGIISSFLAITEGAMQDPTMLADGVSQALITTAGGMLGCNSCGDGVPYFSAPYH